MNEMLPCPHCGGVARLEDARHHDGFFGDHKEGTFYVRCVAGCLAMKRTAEGAFKAWNRRSEVAEPFDLLSKWRPIGWVDNACRECVPLGDIVIAGFRCVYHKCKQAAESKEGEG